ncbi:MAG TPA: hypothetical protein VM578_00360 [Candidatus Saccharimonadales bacterium]|nr:hypothetical protein [Candidatus Saccharimonadales bacterium]
MSQIRFAITLMLALCFLPGMLEAQGPYGRDEGQYVILSAQYGTERSHVDVTRRLKELAREDRPFRIENNIFGVDPEPRVEKVLRIFARGPNGQEQMFEYREGSVVDGAQFQGWRNGNWGEGGWRGNWRGGEDRSRGDFGRDVDSGQYLILSAQYGNERRHVDVTRRLKELARADQPFRVSNDAFGVDPAPRVSKVLRIYARDPNGRERMFEYREGRVVDGAQFRGWRRGDWGEGGWSGNWRGEERR